MQVKRNEWMVLKQQNMKGQEDVFALLQSFISPVPLKLLKNDTKKKRTLDLNC